MKKVYLYTLVFIFFAIIFIPAPSLWTKEKPQINNIKAPSKKISGKSFKVLRQKSGEVIEVDEFTYICGVVGAEMDAGNNIEALKAQAVASYTLALRAIDKNDGSKDLKGADFSDDYNTFQSFLTYDELKKKYGDNYEAAIGNIEKAVKSVYPEYLTYKTEPALSVYHAISGGKTESCKNIWGSEEKYLEPVPSVGDLLAKGYQSEKAFKTADLKKKLESLEIKWSGEKDRWFKESAVSDSGTVLSVTVSGTKVKGTALRVLLDLRSANFDVKYSKDKDTFTFVCRGYGHGVGMSQNGAEYMAENGSSYKEILNWYYNGCEITINNV